MSSFLYCSSGPSRKSSTKPVLTYGRARPYIGVTNTEIASRAVACGKGVFVGAMYSRLRETVFDGPSASSDSPPESRCTSAHGDVREHCDQNARAGASGTRADGRIGTTGWPNPTSSVVAIPPRSRTATRWADAVRAASSRSCTVVPRFSLTRSVARCVNNRPMAAATQTPAA